jgi:hypothetical protein
MPDIVTLDPKPSQDAPTVDPQPAAAQGVHVTPNAVKRIRVILAKEGIAPEEGGLRLGVKGGGCSGLSYAIAFDSHPRERDRIFTFEELCLSERNDARLRRDADAPGIQLHQSELHAFLRLRYIVFCLERHAHKGRSC